MSETFKQILVLFVGVLLLINGLTVIKKRRFEIGIGGRATARPIISVPIKGLGAITFGISSIICGLLILLYMAVMYARQETGSLDAVFSVGTVAIIGLLAAGLVIGFLLQILEELIRNSGKQEDQEPK